MSAHGRIDRIPFRTRTPADYEEMYACSPPWEINRPQSAFAELATSGIFGGKVLDVGCGSGEHALLAAGLGLDATGVDSSQVAIDLAKRKARERKLPARFLVLDALELTLLREKFDTVLDSGLFHALDDQQRATYIEQLRTIVSPCGHVFVLCFSEKQPGMNGPRRIAESELRAAFERGWRVERIRRTRIDTNEGDEGAHALLGAFIRA